MPTILSGGVSVSAADLKCLENDLLDVEEWIRNAITGKINNCRDRLILEWSPRLLDDPAVKTIPANRDELVNLITARTDYRNRVNREGA